jgi:ribosome recycling factor
MAYNFQQFQSRIDEIKEWLVKELSTIRTGRATITLLDGVQVNSYGANMPLNQVANTLSEDARTLRITPFDHSQIQAIEKAINDADLGVSIAVDATGVRVIFPELTSERREILIKQAHKKLEDARISLRTERDEVWNQIQDQQKAGDISEDEKYQSKDEMQKLVDDVQKNFDSMTSEKEAEINS